MFVWQNELFSVMTTFQWNIFSWYNHLNIQISKYSNIQISEYLVGASVLARDDSWVRKDKPTTRLKPAAVRIDLVREGIVNHQYEHNAITL